MSKNLFWLYAHITAFLNAWSAKFLLPAALLALFGNLAWVFLFHPEKSDLPPALGLAIALLALLGAGYSLRFSGLVRRVDVRDDGLHLFDLGQETVVPYDLVAKIHWQGSGRNAWVRVDFRPEAPVTSVLFFPASQDVIDGELTVVRDIRRRAKLTGQTPSP